MIDQLDIRIRNTFVKCQQKPAVTRGMRKDSVFTLYKYFKIMKFVRELRIELEYEKIFDKAKVHKHSVKLHKMTQSHCHDRPLPLT